MVDAAEQTAPAGRDRRVRRRLSVDARRDELIETALELFSRRPPEEVSIDDVAAAAGASRALVYHYFGGKQELYLAALRSAAGKLDTLLEAPTEGTSLERLRLSLCRYFQFVEDHAPGYLAMVRGGALPGSGEVGAIIEGTRALLLDRITREISDGPPRPVLRVTLRMWMAAVETAALDWLEHRDLPRPQLEALLVDQIVLMLAQAAQSDAALAEVLARMAQEQGARSGDDADAESDDTKAAEAPRGGSAA
ncbi:TetR/AcrR family transcriptional regulator [Actinocorallia sp. API 0066]|uniref:TetR/AcrR family transcriptional regulator n=1 Tax=Actinocorallia sp. API 0066 TaxID=2896846 RepID=UPI001E571C4B|nr:TetR/AcrR family transcriptional regulator [Actinocorallia sp. API 0066]MCD0452354.1 TetR/AcrR family transcriptional regulator [Actinocorallia sp. API 0066]